MTLENDDGKGRWNDQVVEIKPSVWGRTNPSIDAELGKRGSLGWVRVAAPPSQGSDPLRLYFKRPQ